MILNELYQQWKDNFCALINNNYNNDTDHSSNNC